MDAWLTMESLAALAANPRTRLTPVLVRCGSGRFTTPAQNAAHFIDIIERDEAHDADYVRDVSVRA